MQQKRKGRRQFAASVLLFTLGLGAVYWFIDTTLCSLTSSSISATSWFLDPGMSVLGHRLVVLCFFMIFGSHVQYTVRKLREQDDVLHETEARYQGLVETSTDAIVSVNEQLQVIQWNEAASLLFGYSKGLIMGRNIKIVIPTKYRKGCEEGLQRVLSSGETMVMGRTVEMEGLRKDGTITPIEVSLSADKRDGSWVFSAIVRETTERRRAMEALRESEEKYRNLFENTKDAVIIWTAEGKILGVNQATLEIFGYTSEDIIGMEIADLYRGHRDLEDFTHQLDLAGAVRGYEIQLKKKNGVFLDCLLTATVRKGKNGVILGYQGIVRDVTVFKQNEKALKGTMDKLHKSIGGVTQAVSAIVESRDPYTAGHQVRVAALARAIAQEMGLSADQVDAVRMAGVLHDLGKIAVPAEILTSPGRLTDKAFDLIKDHPKTGYDILREIDFPWPIADIVLQHHERLDGSGYPGGLTEKDILLEARILTVADVVEAMASHRPYRPALGIDKALTEIEMLKGVAYDSAVVNACVRLFRKKGYKIVQSQSVFSPRFEARHFAGDDDRNADSSVRRPLTQRQAGSAREPLPAPVIL